MRAIVLLGALSLLPLGFVAGCGEFDQQLTDENVNRVDVPSWRGADQRHMAPGWEAGNKAAWDAQMRKRVMGQNEYTRVE